MLDFAKITFLGGAGEVTGSKVFIETCNKGILVDCGVFQGAKELRLLNWKDLPIDVSKIDVVLLTHGHLDHVGYLPRLINQGFRGIVLGTGPTLAIAEIVLLDSAKIHEEEAEKANLEKYSKHDPALAFFTTEEAEKIIRTFRVHPVDEWVEFSEHISIRFQCNGHIIGSTFIELEINRKRFVFSGDLGRINDPLLADPLKPEWADYLFLESTYGDKLHPEEDLDAFLTDLIYETIQKKGNLIIPSFAIERLQTLIYTLWMLHKKNKIPPIPIIVDSPMGNNVLDVFYDFMSWHKLSIEDYRSICERMTIIQSYRQTWETIDNPRSKIIIAGSGMVTGGRVLTYLQYLIDDPANTVLLIGYQAEGTRGRKLEDGAKEIKIYGKYYPVHADIKRIASLSAHADQSGLVDWVNSIINYPEKIFLMHGEKEALQSLRLKLESTYGWKTEVPELHSKYTLTV